MQQIDIFNDFDSEAYDKALAFIYEESEQGHSVSSTSYGLVSPALNNFQIKQLFDNIFYFRKGLLIYEYQNNYYEDAFPANTVPTYMKPGGVAKKFIENGGFKKVFQQLKEEAANKAKIEELNQKALIAAVQSEKHAKKSTWATWIASIAAIISILLSVYFSTQSNKDIDELKDKIINLDKKRSLMDVNKPIIDSPVNKTNASLPTGK